MTDDYDVIHGFADGEAVEPEALERALGDPDGRRQLIDLLVLRGFMTNPSLAPAVAPARRRGLGRSLVRWSIAAVVMIAAASAGYAAGARATATRDRRDLASRLAAPAQTQAAPTPSAVAPEPTRVIRFEPGIDWTEHQGGH
jgi:hypothetical protein